MYSLVMNITGVNTPCGSQEEVTASDASMSTGAVEIRRIAGDRSCTL